MAAPCLHLLGQPAWDGPDGLCPLKPAKPNVLALFLAAQPGRMVSRTLLAATFWEDLAEPEGRRALSVTLTRLRRSWPAWPVHCEDDAVGWRGGDVDVAIFRERVAAADLESAVALWRGPFLDGVSLVAGDGFERWLQTERQAWERRVMGALAGLARAAADAAAWDRLAAHARQALAIDPLQERFHGWLVEALARSGDRAAALSQYEACRRVLQTELGVAPSPELVALRDAVVTGALAGRSPLADVRPELAGGRMAPAPQLARSAPVPTLIGRRCELRLVEETLAGTAGGAGRIVLLHGEAGTGKSRLAQEVLWRRSGGAGLTLTGHCYETTYGLPYAPFVEALEGLDLRRLGLPAALLAPLAGLLPEMGLRHPGPPAAEQLGLFQGVARLLQALPRPTLLVLEDLHWADEASRLLLAYLARRPAGEGAALLATARAGELPEPMRRLWRDVEREGRLVWIELGALSREETVALAQAVGGRRGRALGERIHAETGGNPLYVVELARSVTETGDLSRMGGALPAGIPAVVAGRVARLPAPAADLLATACIFPRGAPFGLLRAMSGLPEGRALAAHDALVRAGLLHEVAGGRVEFGHELVRRAVGEGLTRSRRATLHGRAYRALAAGGEASPDTLATHAAAAGLWEPAVRWRREAADAALSIGAYPVAAWHIEEALAHLGRLASTPERTELASALRGRLEELGHWSDPRGQPGLPTLDAAAGVRLHQAEVLFMQGHGRQALALLEGMLPEVGTRAEPTLHAYALAGVAICRLLLGEYRQAAASFGEATQRAGESLRQLNGLTADGALAGAWACLGEFARAEEALGSLARQVRSGPHPALASNLLGVRAQVAYLRGDWVGAAACSRDGAELAREAQHRYNEYFASIWLGAALLGSGDVRGSLDALACSVRLARQARTRILLDWVCALLAEARLRAGQPEAAAAASRAGLRLARHNGYRHGEALCVRSLGLCAAAAGDVAAAQEHLRLAARRLRSLGARPHLAACHADLAKIAGSETEREEHARQADALRRRMGLTSDPLLEPAGSVRPSRA